MNGRHPRPSRRAVYAGIAWLASSQFGAGLTITMNYNLGNSQEPTTDPAGGLLLGITQAAADRWEQIIEDPWVLSIDLRYRNPLEFSDPTETYAHAAPTSAIDGKPVAGYVEFNNFWDFFYTRRRRWTMSS